MRVFFCKVRDAIKICANANPDLPENCVRLWELILERLVPVFENLVKKATGIKNKFTNNYNTINDLYLLPAPVCLHTVYKYFLCQYFHVCLFHYVCICFCINTFSILPLPSRQFSEYRFIKYGFTFHKFQE